MLYGHRWCIHIVICVGVFAMLAFH